MEERGYESIDRSVEIVGSSIRQLRVESKSETHLHFYVNYNGKSKENLEAAGETSEYLDAISLAELDAKKGPRLDGTHYRPAIYSPPPSPLAKVSLANDKVPPGLRLTRTNAVVKKFVNQSQSTQCAPRALKKQAVTPSRIPVRQISSPAIDRYSESPTHMPSARFPSAFDQNDQGYLKPPVLHGRISSDKRTDRKPAENMSNLSRSMNLSTSDLREKQRASEDEKGFLVLFDKSNKCFLAWDVTRNEQWKYANLPESWPSKSFTTVALGNAIFLLTSDRKLFRYDRNWLRMNNMKCGHGLKPPAVAINGDIFVAGSFGSEGSKATECFNPRNNQWFKITSMPRKKADHALVSSKDAIYCIGGIGHRSVERLNPLRKTWESLSPMNIARKCFAAVVSERKIYAIGGEQSGKAGKSPIASVEIYDITADTWTVIQSVQIPRSRFSAFVIRDTLFAIGGDSESYHKDIKTMERLDLTATIKQWTLMVLPNGVDIDAMSAVILWNSLP